MRNSCSRELNAALKVGATALALHRAQLVFQKEQLASTNQHSFCLPSIP